MHIPLLGCPCGWRDLLVDALLFAALFLWARMRPVALPNPTASAAPAAAARSGARMTPDARPAETAPLLAKEAPRTGAHSADVAEGVEVAALTEGAAVTQEEAASSKVQGTVLYGSQTGTCRTLANALVARAAERGVPLRAVDTASYEVEGIWKEAALLVLMPTYEGGAPPEGARWLYQFLDESAEDFRVGKEALLKTRFSVMGIGNALYGAHFGAAAKRIDAALAGLGARRMMDLALGDHDAGDVETTFDAWAGAAISALSEGASRAEASRPAGADEAAAGDDDYDSSDDDDDDDAARGPLTDLEDLAGAAPRGAAINEPPSVSKAPKEMVTPIVRANLTKQGYKVIGTHSGVKLCRWTKAMLRGRGGCYKHAFYGIASHRCMEATPSLACANKCVFCWRHHTNPVAKTWKWLQDEPDFIVQGAVDMHKKMINEYKGVPGVKQERFVEGMEPKHCALSLVGEPIMYPKINDLVGELHARGMSSFLVTNAQFPDAIRAMQPVTQLYVSIDAATPETLKAVDRPLFADFWERFIECLKLLKEKRQRTVYRLTLVKGWNMEEVGNYVKLLSLGEPDLIEIKGVTYCGSSGASSLTMKNVPYHKDVCEFGQALCDGTDGVYELACEHEHSCCILLARVDRFRDENNRWHTWIDYDAFERLANSGEPFGTADYTAPTPDWAVYGAPEAGFDPQETRVKKVRNHPGKEAKVLSENT